jgi:ABC-type lipoprotein export system ATPase subunit
LTILPGTGKDGRREDFARLTLRPGDMVAVVGHTGSGKSRLIKDVEQLVQGDSITHRHILIDGKPIPLEEQQPRSTGLIAHLGQNMRFVLDCRVDEFLTLHIRCRDTSANPVQVLALANSLTPEPISLAQGLTTLSGGQSRALMIADIALVCGSPIVLVDEIENAGIDKSRALDVLTGRDKIILVVTHDPHTALLCRRRIRVENGAVTEVMERGAGEEKLLASLEEQYAHQRQLRENLRDGGVLA